MIGTMRTPGGVHLGALSVLSGQPGSVRVAIWRRMRRFETGINDVETYISFHRTLDSGLQLPMPCRGDILAGRRSDPFSEMHGMPSSQRPCPDVPARLQVGTAVGEGNP